MARQPGVTLNPRARAAFWTAAALGTAHAAWSGYWALGGQALLDTVGQWAVESSAERPWYTFAVLMGVTVAKLAGAWFPLLAETGRLAGRRLWRTLSWVGGPGLILYGGADVVAGILVVSGWYDADVTDRTAVYGHAFLWGPHFALWGLALTLALIWSRPTDERTR